MPCTSGATATRRGHVGAGPSRYITDPFQPRDIVAVIQQIQRREPTLAGQVAELSRLVIELNSALQRHTGANERAEPGCRNLVLDLAGAPVLVEADLSEPDDGPCITMAYIGGSWVDAHAFAPHVVRSLAAQAVAELQREAAVERDAQAADAAAWLEAA